jgi:hypothetical protein
VTFLDKNVPNDVGFKVTLSMHTTFAHMVKTVAKHLKRNSTHLQVKPNLT